MDPSVPPPVPAPAYPPVPAQSGGAKKWVLFGCGGCLGLLVLGGIVMAAIMYFAMGAMKKSDVFAEALKRAQNSPEVQAAIGTPVDTGWMMQGSLNYNNGEGQADLTIPLKGPKGEAGLSVKSSKAANGPWEYSVMEVALPDGTKVDLRTP